MKRPMLVVSEQVHEMLRDIKYQIRKTYGDIVTEALVEYVKNHQIKMPFGGFVEKEVKEE